MNTTDAIVDAILEAGLRNGGTEAIDDATPLAALSFSGGDRALAGGEFICAFEGVFGVTIPNRIATAAMARLDRGRGTVADLAAIIYRWRNPPQRPKRARLQPGQMCLGL